MNDITDELSPPTKDYLQAWTNPQSQQVTFYDPSKFPMDIICNGFSIKETLLNVLDKYNNGYRMDLPPDELNNLVQELTDALAIKCRLKQGKL